METGHLTAETFRGPFDLETTVNSGQTFLWRPTGAGWYRTVHGTTVIEVAERDGGVDWRSNTDPTEVLKRRLGLTADLPQIFEEFPAAPVLQTAKERYAGLRIVTEPVVPTVISFILSAQMRIDRIHDLVTALRTNYGPAIEWQGKTVYGFPRPAQLAAATEEELRDLGLGYRAPYVEETAEMLRDGAVDLDAVSSMEYEAAREAVTEFVGVGPKVADCVLLFGMDFQEPVPLDTWIQTAIEEHFPDAARETYTETSRAIRDRLGPRPGYAQTYVFTHLRTGGSEQ